MPCGKDEFQQEFQYYGIMMERRAQRPTRANMDGTHCAYLYSGLRRAPHNFQDTVHSESGQAVRSVRRSHDGLYSTHRGTSKGTPNEHYLYLPTRATTTLSSKTKHSIRVVKTTCYVPTCMWLWTARRRHQRGGGQSTARAASEATVTRTAGLSLRLPVPVPVVGPPP